MWIKMKVTKRSSPDGIVVKEYEAGRTYDMTAHQAPLIIEQDWGEEALGPEDVVVARTAVAEPAGGEPVGDAPGGGEPETKGLTAGAPENK